MAKPENRQDKHEAEGKHEEFIPSREAELKRRDLAEKRIEQENKDAIELADRETAKAVAEARTKLLARLGQLTYDWARHEVALREIIAESNKIGGILQKADNPA